MENKNLNVRHNCKKIQLVIIDSDTIGYIQPEKPYMITVLRTKSYYIPQTGSFPLNESMNVRLAGKTDFERIGVSFDHYANDPEYLHADNVNTNI